MVYNTVVPGAKESLNLIGKMANFSSLLIKNNYILTNY